MPTKSHTLSRCLKYETKQEWKGSPSHWVHLPLREEEKGSGIMASTEILTDALTWKSDQWMGTGKHYIRQPGKSLVGDVYLNWNPQGEKDWPPRCVERVPPAEGTASAKAWGRNSPGFLEEQGGASTAECNMWGA